MPDNFQKLAVQQNLNTMAINRALEQIESTGRALPCKVVSVSGAIVTVSFEVNVPATAADGSTTYYQLPQVTIPKAESAWFRNPTQVGDLGLAIPADTSLGGVSGLGAGTAIYGTDYGNLSSLIFQPIGTTAFATMPDTQKAWVNGPAGAVMSDAAKTALVTCAANLITIMASSGTVQIQGSGTASGDAIVRVSDLQTVINTLCTTVLPAWGAAHFQSGTSTPATISAPTVTGSTKAFSG
jgi:hypothetical protein